RPAAPGPSRHPAHGGPARLARRGRGGGASAGVEVPPLRDPVRGAARAGPGCEHSLRALRRGGLAPARAEDRRGSAGRPDARGGQPPPPPPRGLPPRIDGQRLAGPGGAASGDVNPADSRVAHAAFALALLAGVAPLWCARQLPMVDLPQHLHLISVLHRLKDPTTLYPQVFAARAELTPYLGYYYLVSGLSWLVPLELPHRPFLRGML